MKIITKFELNRISQIQNITLEKWFPALFLFNMGNPIHFAIYHDTCQLRRDSVRPKMRIFKFRKKILNHSIPKFYENTLSYKLNFRRWGCSELLLEIQLCFSGSIFFDWPRRKTKFSNKIVIPVKISKLMSKEPVTQLFLPMWHVPEGRISILYKPTF